jgi:hypothetical protein
MAEGDAAAIARHIATQSLAWSSNVPESARAAFDAYAVPASVSARQIRLWLVTHGIPLASVDAAIDSIADATARETVRVEWDYAPYVERSHQFLVPLAAALGLDEASIDQAFREAATI